MSESIIVTRFFVFADVQHYSRIPDSAMPQFVERFLGGVMALFDGEPDGLRAPLFSNTWGDAFLFVFDGAGAAGEAGLAVREWQRREPFRVEGMSEPLGLRIGMHAGPVHCGRDPITGRELYLGSHINRAARIEPITEEGQIFVSREFAALAEMEGVRAFRCVPQGIADLPKASGRIPVYRLERNRDDSTPEGMVR